MRWTGRMRIFRTGHYHFQLISDDGSKLWLDNRYTINNDGLHGWRARHSRRHVRAGWHLVRVEMFERGGHAGMLFRYRGPDTGNRWRVVRAVRNAGGSSLKEQVYYFGQGGRCQNLNSRKANMARWKHAWTLPSIVDVSARACVCDCVVCLCVRARKYQKPLLGWCGDIIKNTSERRNCQSLYSLALDRRVRADQVKLVDSWVAFFCDRKL